MSINTGVAPALRIASPVAVKVNRIVMIRSLLSQYSFPLIFMALHQNLWVKIRKILIYIKEGSPKGISFIPFSAVHPSVQ